MQDFLKIGRLNMILHVATFHAEGQTVFVYEVLPRPHVLCQLFSSYKEIFYWKLIVLNSLLVQHRTPLTYEDLTQWKTPSSPCVYGSTEVVDAA